MGTSKRKPIRRKSSKKKSSAKVFWRGLLIVIAVLLFVGVTSYHYRDALAYYFSFKSRHTTFPEGTSKVSEARIYQILKKYPEKVYGIDVSQYQGKIEWEQVRAIEDSFPVSFALIRATAGKNLLDKQFKRNWEQSKQNKLIRGAYHYYRPNENSIQQANNFIKYVRLESGDLPPVLDIENLPKTQSIDSLRVGLKRWLAKVEDHYKVKPIIYSGESYYKDFLQKDFKGYTFWIANYNFFVEDIKDEWTFWQFTEKGVVQGIKSPVDLNIYNGTPKMLQYLTIK